MFWILRRTRLSSAVSFFNTINNNNSSNSNNNACAEKRPARKEYRRLQQTEENADNKKNHVSSSNRHNNSCCHHCTCCLQIDNAINNETKTRMSDTIVAVDSNGCCTTSIPEGSKSKTSTQECCNYNTCPSGRDNKQSLCCPCECICNCYQCNHSNTPHDPDVLNTDTDSSCSEYDFDNDDLKNTYSDDPDEYDESLTCNVCDRSFSCHRVLAAHQQKKRHFGCSSCDSLFPSLMALEHHKEEFEHWSGNENCCTESEEDDEENSDLTVESEEMERLL